MRIPKTHPVKPLKPGQDAAQRATCGTCGRSWDDGKVTSMTPTPAGRCPFEAFHDGQRKAHTLTADDKERILRAVDDALGCQFSDYSWFEMIDDAGLTPREARYAKNNIGYRAVNIHQLNRQRRIETAAREVVKRWERGDLAGAVRSLAAAIEARQS